MSGNDNLNQFDDLIQELKQGAGRPSSPSATFKNELRDQLLNQYQQSSFSVANFGRWAGTAVALGVLAIIVFFSWTTFGQRSNAVSAQMGTVDVPDRDEFIVYDQLRIELPMWTEFDSGYAEMTAESWQSLDGTFFRGEVVDANGKQRVFVQGDGQFLWRGGFDSRAGQMETAALQYFAVFHALAQAGGWAGVSTTPPFYDDLGWDGLAQSVVRLDWDCTGAECVNNYLVEPPLGINSRGGEYEPYGWGVSLIDTETTAKGRSLTTYRIDYSPNQDSTVSSQYRLAKLDSNSHAVVEVADYDGDTLLRRLERVTHQIMPRGSFPEEQFTRLPEGVGVSFILPEGRVTELASLKAEPGGEETAVLPTGTHVYLDGIMDNLPAITLDGVTWRHVAAKDIGEGWIDETLLQWPLTFDGQLVELDTSRLPTAVPAGTQLIILNNYRAELLALSPEEVGENQHLLEQVLADIEAEIARLEQLQAETALSSFNDGPLLTKHQLSATQLNAGGTLAVTLFWDGEPKSVTNIAVHLTDANGNVLSQADQPWSEEMNVTLTIPEALTDDVYEIVVIQYDAATGVRQDSLLLQEIVVETAVPQHAIVSGTESNGLTLRNEPNGQELGILEEGTVVLLNDEPRLESEGLIWQSVSTTIGTGWVVADFLEYPEGYTPTETIPVSPDDLWIVKATQLPRTSPDEAITLEVTVGYELVTADETALSLSFVHPTWGESLDGYRYPNYNALGDEYAIQSGTGSVTFTTTVEPETITSAIGSDENGQQTSDLILMGFDNGITFDMQSVEEITYP